MDKRLREQLHKLLEALEKIDDISCSRKADSSPRNVLFDIKKICHNTLEEFERVLKEVVRD